MAAASNEVLAVDPVEVRHLLNSAQTFLSGQGKVARRKALRPMVVRYLSEGGQTGGFLRWLVSEWGRSDPTRTRSARWPAWAASDVALVMWRLLVVVGLTDLQALHLLDEWHGRPNQVGNPAAFADTRTDDQIRDESRHVEEFEVIRHTTSAGLPTLGKGSR